jgi:endonuclease-3
MCVPRESPVERRRRARRLVRRLAAAYPDASLALAWRNPFELLVATILSAQCTDKKVNEVTPRLFERWPTAHELAGADPAAVEAVIRPTGFYRQKARSIQGAASEIATRFGGRVPGTLEELVSLRGVARKTANIVLGHAFGVPGLAMDTHMQRVNQRLGLSAQDEPDRIERDLMELIPRAEWTAYTSRVIHHGRVCCTARNPRCPGCPLLADCPWGRKAVGAGGARARRASRPRRP